MGKQFKFAGKREHYLTAWRDFRDLTLERMAALISDLPESTGLTKATLSRIESGKIPYNRETLEAYSVVLGVSKADLISRRPPRPEDEAWTLFEAPKSAKPKKPGRRRKPR